MRLERASRTEVDVGPARVGLADLEERHVERSFALADLAEGFLEAGVAAEEDAVVRPHDRPGRPERSETERHASAVEVPGRSGDDLDATGQAIALPPLVLDDVITRHAPRLEMRRHTERHVEDDALRRERSHRRHVQMVEVLVRDEDSIDVRKIRERERRRMKALRPHPA
ncbi:MAG: hypothetical protein K0S65_594 [Labilithrix sp.]|nr:hypothetical protein [Labilithrix sp.]